MTAFWQQLIAEKTQSSDTDTFREQLPDVGALHALLIKAQVTTGATSGRNKYLHDALSNIRVKSARRDPIMQVDSIELQKWMECFKGVPLTEVVDWQASKVNELVLPIWFGRQLYDPNYFYPLSRHTQSFLEIDHAFTAAADGGFATGTLKFDVKALITPKEEILSYEGTLALRNLYTHTSVASGDENFDMPGESILRGIGMYCYELAIAEDTDITKIVFKNRRDQQILAELGYDDFIHMTQEEFGGFCERHITDLAQNNDTVVTLMGEILSAIAKPRTAVDTTGDVLVSVIIDAISGDQLTYDVGSVDITAGAETITALASDQIIDCIVKAKFPSHFGALMFNKPDSRVGYWNERDDGNIRLIATQGGAGATVKVSVQELQDW